MEGEVGSLFALYGRLLDWVESHIPQYVTPNHLSLSRVAALPIILIAFLADPFVALVVYALACLTDLFDGYVARKRGKVTEFGKILDEITDKVFVFGIVLVLLWADKIPIELLSLKVLCITAILVRDIGITILRRCFPKRAKKVPSLGIAKAKTAIFMLALGCIMVGDSQEVYLVWVDQVGVSLLHFAAALAVISGTQYVWRFATVRV